MRKIYSTRLSKKYSNSNPINCSVAPTSHHNNIMTHRICLLLNQWTHRSSPPTWNLNPPSIPAPSFSFWTHTEHGLKQQAGSVRRVYWDDCGPFLCPRCLTTSRPEVSSSAGSRANTQSARDNREDPEVVLSCSHRGRSQFQELNWFQADLRNDCWTVYSPQDVRWRMLTMLSAATCCSKPDLEENAQIMRCISGLPLFLVEEF